jgi:predicted acetyltransferase
MAVEIVTPTNYDEWRPFDQVIAASFGEGWEEPKPEELEIREREAPYDFCVGVKDGGEVLGGCGSYEFDLSMPGGCGVSVAALTAVGGNGTKQGRGALRAMMVEHLERARSRGHAASILNASEASIYSQFGYGHATTMVGYEVDSDRAQLRTPLEDAGSLELVTDLLPALEDFRAAYEACARTVPGTGARDELWWKRVLGPKQTWRGGGKQIGVIHRDADGNPDGYLLYTIKETGGWVNDDVLNIREMLGASVSTDLALFQYAVRVPLQRKVVWREGPVDFPARHHLFDPRQQHVVDQHDLLWLRPLDIVTLLSSRTYSADDTFVVAIDDRLFEDQRGPWKVSIADGIAAVEPTSDVPDIELTPSEVAMVLLGDHRVQELATAGILDAEASVIRRLDRAFLTDRRPYNFSKF